jgi:UDP-N-acetylmuramate--alanine ligase
VGEKSQKSKSKRLLIAAGGTGGHVFPGLAVADLVRKLGFEVEWLGGENGLEQRLIPGRYPLHTLPMMAFRGRGFLSKGRAVVGLIRAFIEARKILIARQASIVLVMGGYVSAPAGLAAKSLGIPFIIHEQNAVAGLANRCLSRFAVQIFEAFPGVFPQHKKAIHSGNPLRASFYMQQPPKKQGRQLRILVIGGSRGASAINQLIRATIANFVGSPISWWHQTGEDEFEEYQRSYVGQSQVRCDAFIEDTSTAFHWADLVISRAGALSVSEIAAVGVAAVLIPYPSAVDDHQYHNATYLEKLSAAVILRQSDATVELLTEKIQAFIKDPDELVSMGARAKELAMPQAAHLIAASCLNFSGLNKKFEFLEQLGIHRLHAVGIGGIGVSGLVVILLQSGYAVTGTDSQRTKTTEYLQSLGAKITDNPCEQLEIADCVIYSRAVSLDHPDMLVAKRRGIPIYSRGEFLAKMVGNNPSLVVAGSHGKSTTSGWAAFSLQAAGVVVNTYLGAVIEGEDTSVRLITPDAPWVLESDESDGSCFLLSPSCLIITNIDADHLENYEGSLAVLQDRMVEWANRMDMSSVVIACLDDPGVQAILPRLKGRKLTYGFSEKADFQLLSCNQQGMYSELLWRMPDGERVAAKIQLAGKHNALNGLAAWVASREFSFLKPAELTPAWSAYPGVKRRMSVHGSLAVHAGEVLIVEDYGHHPREIQVTLDALQGAWPEKRVVMLFQPHRYTRTRHLFQEFVEVLKKVEKLYLLPIYAAGEKQDLEVSSDKLAAAIEAEGVESPGLYKDLNEAEQTLRQILKPGDVLLLQGAGSVGELARKLCFSPAVSDK